MRRRPPNRKRIEQLGRRRHLLPHTRVDGYGSVMQRKEDVIAGLDGVSSLRDFGGCYIVAGRYLLEPARRLRAEVVSMVDHGDMAEYRRRAAELAVALPHARFDTVEGDFRDPALFASLEPVDVSILYEVLLHQENYVEVVRNVTRTTLRYVCVSQPCLREQYFVLPSSSTLLQFWDEPLKDLLREGSWWPKEERPARFDSASWMWGHTTSHLVDVFGGLGWTVASGEVIDDVCGPHWEFPLVVFRAPG